MSPRGNAPSYIPPQDLQIPVQKCISTASPPRFLPCLAALVPPGWAAANSAYLPWAGCAGNNQLLCTCCPSLLGCLFIKLIHSYSPHLPAWISFPLNISLSIGFLLQREGSSYVPKLGTAPPPVPSTMQVRTEIWEEPNKMGLRESPVCSPTCEYHTLGKYQLVKERR